MSTTSPPANKKQKMSEVPDEKVVLLQIGESRFQVRGVTFNELKNKEGFTIEGDTYYADRDGDIFKYILKYLRNKTISFPNDFNDGELLMKEAEFYGLSELKEHVENGAGKPEIVIINIMIPPNVPSGRTVICILLSWTTDKLEESHFDWETLFKGFIDRLNEFKLYSCKVADFGIHIDEVFRNSPEKFVQVLQNNDTSHFAFRVVDKGVPSTIFNGFLMSGFSLVTDRTSCNVKHSGKQYKSVRRLRFQRIKPVN